MSFNRSRQKQINHKAKAFSLIEVAVVLIIIGVFVAGIFVANGMISKSRLQAAKSLAVSSPIRTFKENALWLETSLDDSFNINETETDSPITAWHDQKVAYPHKASVVAVGYGPVYSNTINHVHAVKFSGSDVNYLEIEDASFLNNTNYTITVLEKRQSNDSDNYFLGESPAGTANQNLALGYSLNGKVLHAQGSNSYDSNVSSYEDTINKPRLFTFTHSSTAGKKTYINGILAAEDPSNTAPLNNISRLAIGKGYTGEIGEIAIFTRDLKEEEIRIIQDYAAKKWSRKVPSTATSCVSGTVTESGCSMTCYTSSFAGLSSPSSIADGATIDATCGQSGFDGNNRSLTCSGGSISGSACDCASGYTKIGSTCIRQCSITPEGVSSLMVAIEGSSASSSCNVDHYTGAAAFTCTSGSPVYSSVCSCATGYTGSGCSGCDTGYSLNATTGACELKCSSSLPTGIAGPLNAGTSLTQACGAGYSGSITYNCSNGSFSLVSGSCSVLPSDCTGGVINTTAFSGYAIHVFNSSGTLNCPSSKTAQVLVVAGGGGGGGCISGGGGAGGLIYNASYTINSGDTSVTVGAGGEGGNGWDSSQQHGKKGANSVFGSITAIGGGGGADHRFSSTLPNDGGSGGGDALHNVDSGNTQDNGLGTAGQGNNGGSCGSASNCYDRAGGGGGAGGVGQASSGSKAGNGGAGVYYGSVFSDSYGHGGWFAGGGGGGVRSGTGSIGTAGNGGGGNGSVNTVGATNALNNTGGGGGGAGFNVVNTAVVGGKGGSGIVIIKYLR
jgi:prepilin-type N-terminal cleavage/methylation domain-containing protein